MHLDQASENRGVTVLPCNGSDNQRWTLHETVTDEFKIRPFLNSNLCLSPDDVQGTGSRLRVKTCVFNDSDSLSKDNTQSNKARKQDWIWKDGSIRRVVDENMVIEYNEPGPVVIGYSHEDSRFRFLNKRWIIMARREQDYHRETNSIRIRNDATVPIECSLNQAGPLYWGVIFPGEEFYRNTGAVWFTTKCQDVSAYGGVGQISYTDAVQSVADITSAIAISVITMGAASKFALSGYAALALSTSLSLAYTAATTNANVNALVETFLFSIASAGIPGDGKQLKSFFQGKYLSTTDDILLDVALSSPREMTKRELAVAVGQEALYGHAYWLTKSSVGQYSNDARNGEVSHYGEYSNGKLYIVRGGAKYRFDSSGQKLVIDPNKIRLDFSSGKKYAFESCSSDSDCISYSCHDSSDDFITGSFCCPNGEDNTRCKGVVKEGGECITDSDCQPDTHCHLHCESTIDCTRTCIFRVEIGGECTESDHCGDDAFCKNNACTAKIEDDEQCPDNDDDACLSGKCALRGKDFGSDYNERICCASGDSVVVMDQQYCAGIKKDGEQCRKNGHCESGELFTRIPEWWNLQSLFRF